MTASQDLSLIRRLEFLLARAGWYLGHDDSYFLVRLQSLAEFLLDARTNHLKGMIYETLGSGGEGERIHRELLTKLSPDETGGTRLVLSCAYHAARYRLTIGGTKTALKEAE